MYFDRPLRDRRVLPFLKPNENCSGYWTRRRFKWVSVVIATGDTMYKVGEMQLRNNTKLTWEMNVGGSGNEGVILLRPRDFWEFGVAMRMAL
jgi:hypothetical protein